MDWGGGAIASLSIYSEGLLKAKNLISIITGNRTLRVVILSYLDLSGTFDDIGDNDGRLSHGNRVII